MTVQAAMADSELPDLGRADAHVRVQALADAILARKGRPAAGPRQDLREAGLSSLDTMNLMLAVEGEFDLFIPQTEMTPENFRSVAAISALLARLD